ncbi:putative serine/threonine-protein kinase [Lycium ferocissimum]|uniref:putative serine/threonine-protein kinase n=1 Tax=Lycium ferocissimum TaxID=112874 RepID=UPI002814D90B|nr:putative serine/threonine-protein kinase [Lycium ferocissimum]
MMRNCCYIAESRSQVFPLANGRDDSICPKSFSCGNLTDLSFPFSLSPQSDCGIVSMSGCDAKPFPKIQLLPEEDWYQAFNKKISLPNSPSISFNMLNLNNFFKCNTTSNNPLNVTQKKNDRFAGYNMYNGCEGFSIYYKLSRDGDEYIGADNLPTNCTLIRLPIQSSHGDLFNCLYEHNCKQMQQFVNEIEILTRLRHNNLVTLYGCTSRQSRELLLVYDYVPNGTLADHLHGDRAKDGSLTWPVRMNIAVETAGALAYLHASDVIHWDVKTNSILLDHNFSVNVADFGISRLFPNDVSHISTAPRGTLY